MSDTARVGGLVQYYKIERETKRKSKKGDGFFVPSSNIHTHISCVALPRAHTLASCVCVSACFHFLGKQHINSIPFVFARTSFTLCTVKVILSLALTVLHRKLNEFHSTVCDLVSFFPVWSINATATLV